MEQINDMPEYLKLLGDKTRLTIMALLKEKIDQTKNKLRLVWGFTWLSLCFLLS